MKRESTIQAAIQRYLDKRHDVYTWRNNTGQARIEGRWIRFGCPGSSDILGLMQGGRMLAIEVKADNGEQSPGQRAWQARVERLGGLYVLARSVDEVHEALERARQRFAQAVEVLP